MLASPPLCSATPSPRYPHRDLRARAYIHECTSLNKLLFIRPVGEMNLRDSYRTRRICTMDSSRFRSYQMHCPPSPSLFPLFSRSLSLPPPPQESLTVDRCFRDAVCRPRTQTRYCSRYDDRRRLSRNRERQSTSTELPFYHYYFFFSNNIVSVEQFITPAI